MSLKNKSAVEIKVDNYLKYLKSIVSINNSDNKLSLIIDNLLGNKNKVLETYIELVFYGQLYTKIKWKSFLTLTFKDEYVIKTKELVNNYLEKFVKYIREKCKIKNYIYVLELTETGRPHIHILLDKTVNKNVLDEEWRYGYLSIESVLEPIGMFIYLMKDFQDNKISNIKKIFGVSHLYSSNVNVRDLLPKLEVDAKLIEKEIFLENLARGYSLDNDKFRKELESSAYGFIYRLAKNLIKINGDIFYEKVYEYIESLKQSRLRGDKVKLVYNFLKSLVKFDIKKIHFYLVFLFLSIGEYYSFNLLNLYNKIEVDVLDLLNKKALNEIEITISRVNDNIQVNLPVDEKEFNIGLIFYNLLLSTYNGYFEIELDRNKDDENIMSNHKIKYKENLLKELSSTEKKTLLLGIFGYRNIMVVPPKDWIPDNNAINMSGGYLMNKYPMYSINPDNKFFPSQVYYKIINKLQSQAVKINWDLLDFVEKNSKVFFDCDRSKIVMVEKELKRLKDLRFDIWHKVKEVAKNYAKLEFQKDFNKLNYKEIGFLFYKYGDDNLKANVDNCKFQYDELISMKSIYDQFLRIYEYLKLYKEYDKLYFPYNYDFRGRVYPYNSEINFMNSSLYRSLFLDVKEDYFDIEVFKIYAVRSFYGEKNKNEIDLKRFVEIEELLKSFRSRLLDVVKAKNMFSFLSCCFEYEKYLKFIKLYPSGRYLSNFLISVDAHCSGSQLLGLLLRDLSVLKSLNLIKQDDNLYDYYLSIIDKYIDFLSKSELENEGLLITSENRELYTEAQDLFKFKLSFIVKDRQKLRKLFKNSIMTFAYGLSLATYLTRIKQTYIELYKEYIENDISLSFERVLEFFKFFYIYYHKISKFGSFYTYLQKIVTNYNERELSVKFTTPLKGEIVQRYIKRSIKRLNLRTSYFKKLEEVVNDTGDFKLPKSINLCFLNYNEINYSKQRTAFSANFIHSLDSSLLLRVLDQLFDVNIFVLPIHDCFLIKPINYKYLLQQYNNQLTYIFLNELDFLDSFLNELVNNLKDSNKDKVNEIKNKILALREVMTIEDLENLRKMVEFSEYSLIISG